MFFWNSCFFDDPADVGNLIWFLCHFWIQLEQSHFIIFKYICALEPVCQNLRFTTTHCVSGKGLKRWMDITFPYILCHFLSWCYPFFPFISSSPGWEKQVSTPQVALTFLISLPTLSLSIGLLREPPSLATGSAIILNTWVEDLGKIECPPLGIPSPSPTWSQAQNTWSALLLLIAKRKVSPWLASNQQVTCFPICKETQGTFLCRQ